MTANPSTGTQETAPGILPIELKNAADGSTWRLFLESEILTLANPEKRPVMKLHRDEAARYIRISWRSRRIRAVSFVFIEGVRVLTFVCPSESVARLLAWLPQELAKQVSKEIRLTGICMVLYGILQLVLPDAFFGACGIALVVAGAFGILLPRRAIYALNSLVLLSTGFFSVGWIPAGISSGALAPENQLIPLGLGAVLVVWGVFQLMKLGPSQRLRSARAVRDERAAFLPTHSELVRHVGRWNFSVAPLLLAYLIAMLLAVYYDTEPDTFLSELELLLPDLIVFGAMIALTVGSGLFFLLRAKANYLEAKMSAQALIAIVIFFFGAQIFNFRATNPLSVFGSIISENRDVFKCPYLWVALIVSVSVFNKWFTKVVDKELEERRASGR